MKYIFLKKTDKNLNLIFDNFYFFLINNFKNIIYKFFLDYNFFILKKNSIYYLYFKNFLERSKLIIKIKNSFSNIIQGFCLHLELIGLGYSVTIKIKKNVLRFNIGFNHSVYYNIPENIIIKTKRKRIFLFSYSFFLLKKVSVELNNFRKLSVYKMKGIKIKDELYKKKN